MNRRLIVRLLQLGALALGSDVAAQAPPESVAAERSEFARWLLVAPTSPLRAIAQVPVGPGVTLGPPTADVPLEGVLLSRIEERDGRVSLASAGTTRPLPRDRAIALGSYQVLAAGLPGQAVVTVFSRDATPHEPPAHYPYAGRWRAVVVLEAVKSPRQQRLLAPDGTEVLATEAGSVALAVGAQRVMLRVFRIPAGGSEESDLEIYFQDSTNARGSYPAGRFVSLVPDRSGRYVLDLNRARNPFCAYNSVFPCPAPWRGNRVPAAVVAGERYSSESPAKPPR